MLSGRFQTHNPAAKLRHCRQFLGDDSAAAGIVSTAATCFDTRYPADWSDWHARMLKIFTFRERKKKERLRQSRTANAVTH